LEIDS